MKITNRFNTANVKALFTKAATVAVVAGAAFMAAPQKANAQVAFGVQFGRPVYRRPAYVAPVPVYSQPYYATPYYANPGYGYAYEGRRDWDDHHDWDRRRDWDRDRDHHFDRDHR